jgi:phospholipase/carboxylesterase
MQLPETVELTTSDNPAGSVIWLHGLGADGHDFEPIVPELRLGESLPLRFVFPHAPIRPVTLNAGMSMRAWYDIYSLDADGRADETGVRQSSAMLEALISREVERGIDSSKIVIAGFSQGGAVAMHTALRSERKLAGLMALSTYLPLRKAFDDEVVANMNAGDTSLPIFMAHGSFDPVLPMQWGFASAELLKENGFEVEWHEYPMAHQVCMEEIDDVRNWLLSVYS